MTWVDYLKSSDASEEEREFILQYGISLERKGFPVILDLNHFAGILNVNVRSLASAVNSPEHFYRSFSIPKRRAEELRKIVSPYPFLSMVQTWIKTNILENIDVHPNCFSFRKGHSIVNNAAMHLNGFDLYKLDLKDFFPGIPIRRNIKIFLNCGYSHKVSFFLGALTSYQNSLPQGAPTSPIISNIIGKKMDNRLHKLSISFQLTYSRYADDITFSGRHISPRFRNIVKTIIGEEKFEINFRKEVLISGKNSKKIVTGISISDGHQLKVPREYKRGLKLDVYRLLKFEYKVDPAKTDF